MPGIARFCLAFQVSPILTITTKFTKFTINLLLIHYYSFLIWISEKKNERATDLNIN